MATQIQERKIISTNSNYKKIVTIVMLFFFISVAYSQNYSTQLIKLNNYLHLLDNGYYGSLEITDGYLIDNFKSGKYCKAKMSDLDYATVEEANKKVVIKCKSSKECVYSTYTDKYHDEMTFSQSADFNTTDFSDMLNDLIDSYNGKQTKKQTTSTNSSSSNDALKQLNDYLKTFDNGYYGYLEIVDDYLYDRFPSGKYTKTPIKELTTATVETENRKVIVNCKSNSDCVFSTYTDAYHKQISFSQSTDFKTSELITLLNNLFASYNGKTITNINVSTSPPNNIIKTNKGRDEKANKRMNSTNKN